MMHGKKGHAISMHAKCRCTSMMSSSPYRCCGDAEDALFTQSLSCNHMLDALFTMHNCTYMQTQTNHKCRLLKTCNMHFSQCTQNPCICRQRKTNHIRKTHYMHIKYMCTNMLHALCRIYTITNKSHTCMQIQYKCTYSMCIIHTYLHYTNTAHALQSYMYRNILTHTFSEFSTICGSSMGEQTPVCCCQEEPDAF